MEWVETTAKTLEEAKELALDRLGVAADEAEFEVLEEPRPGLFGRMRGEARVRARVMPTAVRPKQERRGRGRGRDGRGKNGEDRSRSDEAGTVATDVADADIESDTEESEATKPARPARRQRTADGDRAGRAPRGRSGQQPNQQKEQQVNEHEDSSTGDEVAAAEVGAAAEAFVSGLAAAFGVDTTTSVEIDGSEIEVRLTGSELGLLVGHGGRTLLAVQDLARVASQRRLGDHDTRLRIDIGGYRQKRAEALGRFAAAVAQEVIETGRPKALEPMQSADRKVVHDALASIDGVTSRSEGDDPMRRVVISPA